MAKDLAQLLFKCVLSLCWVEASSANVFRVALVSEYTGSHAGGAAKFIEGFQDFVAPYINTVKGGMAIPRGNPNTYQVEVVPFDTKSDAAEVQGIVNKIGNGTNDAGQNVGEFHAIVAGTSQLNTAMFAPAQALGIVNVHTSGGNPNMWQAANTFAFGLHLPFVWYTRDLMKLASQKGLRTVAIIRSNQHGFSIISCTAALQWAQDAGLTVVGPSVSWCNSYSIESGGCTVVGQNCVCGDQQTVSDFGYSYNIEQVPNFYQVDESAVGNGLVWRTIDNDTATFFGTMFDDMLEQGSFPDVVLNFAVEWHNVVKGMKDRNVSPKMLFGWQDGVTGSWAQASDANGNEVLSGIEGYWALGFGQWHKAMAFTDPVFTSNANAVSTFKAQRGRTLDYDTAGAVAAGVLLYTAMSKYSGNDFASLSLPAKRDAVRVAVQDINDETMWGTIRFNSKHQNNGRGTAAWQIIPDGNHTPQQLCVLPLEAAEIQINLPFPTWESRFGCQAGYYNSGVSCNPCPIGQIQPSATAGMIVNTCTKCGAGQGTDTLGKTVCSDCSPGSKQDGIQDDGICRNCSTGYHQNSAGTTACLPCSPGTFGSQVGLVNCLPCAAGTYQDSSASAQCRNCQRGMFSDSSGHKSCDRCKIGEYADTVGRSQCQSCAGGKLTTAYLGATEQSECLCPAGSYRDKTNREICIACPEGMICGEGSDMLQYALNRSDALSVYPMLTAGYWSDVEDPLNIYECANDERCPGGKPGTCTPNSEGISCARCVDKYYSTATECKKCADIETSQIIFPILPCLLIPIIICIVYWFFRDMPDKWGSFTNCVAAMVFLLLNHYQMVAMGGTSNLRMRPVMDDTWKVWAMSEDAISIFNMDCAGLGGFQTNFVIKALGPVIVLVLAALTFFATQAVGMAVKGVAMDKDRLFNVYFSLLFAFFTGIASSSMTLFRCQSNPNGKLTLKKDLTVICNEDEWKSMLAIAICAVTVYCLGLIVLFTYIIIVAPSKFRDVVFQKRWKFLFIKFRLDKHWWGLVFLIKGVFLNIGPAAFTSAPAQLYWMMITSGIYLLLMVAHFPWRLDLVTILDCAVHTSIIMILSLLSWFSERDDDLNDNMALFTVVMCFVPFIIFVFLAFFVVFPGLQHRLDPTFHEAITERAAQKIKDSFGRVASSDIDSIVELYRNLSQHDQKMLDTASQIVAVEVLGTPSFKLVTSSLRTIEKIQSCSNGENSELKGSVDKRIQDERTNSADDQINETGESKIAHLEKKVAQLQEQYQDALCLKETLAYLREAEAWSAPREMAAYGGPNLPSTPTETPRAAAYASSTPLATPRTPRHMILYNLR